MPANQSQEMFAERYPHVSEWTLGGGWVEIGQSGNWLSFIRALDEGGLVWEGAAEYTSLDQAMEALDAGIAAWNDAN